MAQFEFESLLFPCIMYIITILALIGAIHLIYNICFCQKKCKKCICFHIKPVLKSNNNTKSQANPQHNRDRRKRDKYDDYDMDSESFTSKICKIVCVSTVVFFLIFLFVGCYQQSIYSSMYLNIDILSYHSVVQCRILFCMIAFYVYGKMLLYAYFVLRAYNMLDGSHLNYNKTTVVSILSTYFIMMNFILFCLIYVHLTDDYCNQYNIDGYIHQRRSIVFGIGAAIDGSMAILSVSLLIQKLFALVRQSMNVHGGLSKIAPQLHSTPLNTPRQHSILSHSQTRTQTLTLHKQQQQHSRSRLSIDLSRIRSISSTSSNHTPNKDLKTIKSYAFNTKNSNEKQKKDPEKYEIRLSKQIQTKHINTNRKTNYNYSTVKKKPIDNIIMNSIRRCSRSINDSAEESKSISNVTFSATTHTSHTSTQPTMNHSNPSSTRQSKQRRISRSITPDVDHIDVLGDVPELELQSILSNEQLPDSDINKVKKLSIGRLLQKDELIELSKTNVNISTDIDGNTTNEDIDENMRFEMMEEDETEKMITPPEILLTLGMNAYSSEPQDIDDEYDDGDDAEEELKVLTPLNSLNSFRNSLNRGPNSLRDFSSDTLKIPSNSTANSNSPRNMSPSPRNISRSKSKSKSKSPQSLSNSIKRSTSILQFMSMSRASHIISNISREHIRKFHSVTQYDNEILLLSTKLLILLTVCVISSFCSFLLLFCIIRSKQNSGIFFVYGIDSFINVWCLAFTFKFSNKCYNILFNCGSSNRSTKLCFPMVKTAALTWKFCCWKHTYAKVMTHAPPPSTYPHRNGHNYKMNGMHRVSQSSMTYTAYPYHDQLNNTQQRSSSMIYRMEDDDDDEEDEDQDTKCYMNCCFCCCGNEQEIQIYHMARGEVELMLRQNRKLYR